MNAGGHIAVVARAASAGGSTISAGVRPSVSDGRLLGSALPDLAAMGRFRLLGATSNVDVRAGIALHHRTDDLFHSHAWFRERNRALTDDLISTGVARGPAMACSHVGIELLLDGRLLAEPGIAEANAGAFAAIQRLTGELEELVTARHRDDWRRHLDRLGALGLPTDYDDPAAVAHRLHRILASRPRLALPAEQVGVVTQALEQRRDDIERTALALVDDLARSLGPAAA